MNDGRRALYLEGFSGPNRVEGERGDGKETLFGLYPALKPPKLLGRSDAGLVIEDGRLTSLPPDWTATAYDLSSDGEATNKTAMPPGANFPAVSPNGRLLLVLTPPGTFMGPGFEKVLVKIDTRLTELGSHSKAARGLADIEPHVEWKVQTAARQVPAPDSLFAEPSRAQALVPWDGNDFDVFVRVDV